MSPDILPLQFNRYLLTKDITSIEVFNELFV
jgi:hypothetical protein